MREIKFRAKDIDSGLWVYGNYVKYNEDDGELIHCIVSEERCQVSAELVYTQVDPTTIGEFTGLQDKNGKEIYDGDILKNNLSKFLFALVCWHQNGYFFCDWNMGRHPSNYKCNEYAPLGEVLKFQIDGKKVEFEVIGNVFDNPELLK